jgi:hypothetical protein
MHAWRSLSRRGGGVRWLALSRVHPALALAVAQHDLPSAEKSQHTLEVEVGQVEEDFADFLYFSATSYSTMGIGDVYPAGALRLISGIEGINGLFLIAWSPRSPTL